MISAAVIEALKEIVPADKVLLQEPMKLHTTFRIGGPADCLVYLENEEQLCKIQKYLRLVDVPYTVIGNGSNLLVSDQGYAGIVLVVGKHMSRIEVKDCYLEAEAGALMSQVAKAAKEHGLTGLEFAAGIPGTIGGGAVMNAGAYGGGHKLDRSAASQGHFRRARLKQRTGAGRALQQKARRIYDLQKREAVSPRRVCLLRTFRRQAGGDSGNRRSDLYRRLLREACRRACDPRHAASIR